MEESDLRGMETVSEWDQNAELLLQWQFVILWMEEWQSLECILHQQMNHGYIRGVNNGTVSLHYTSNKEAVRHVQVVNTLHQYPQDGSGNVETSAQEWHYSKRMESRARIRVSRPVITLREVITQNRSWKSRNPPNNLLLQSTTEWTGTSTPPPSPRKVPRGGIPEPPPSIVYSR